MIYAKLAKIVWWTAVKKPSKRKAVLGYLHTGFSYQLREKKKNPAHFHHPQILLPA